MDLPLDKCPGCGGPADNGNDRCVPPNPYYCTKCMLQEQGCCPICGTGTLVEQKQKLVCLKCHAILETCCEGGPCG